MCRRCVTAAVLAASLPFTSPKTIGAQTVLSEKMAQYADLIGGTWSCVTRVPPAPGSSVHEDRSTAVFAIAPGGVVHDHIAAPDYSGDFYIGYDDRAGKYWMTGADSLGTNLSLTSNDGQHYTGTSSMGGVVMNDSATYTRQGPNQRSSHELFTRPGVEASFDTLCTR